MFPGMNPAMMKQAMKKLGIKQEDIDADEVIIRRSSGNIIIKNPSVTKINMQGQETFQITGDIEEGLNEEDMKTVMDSAKCSRSEAEEALKEHGDLTEAIMSLQS